MPVIDAIGICSTDLPRTLAFYRLLGFRFPEVAADQPHIEAERRPGEPRLMIDSATLIAGMLGRPPRPANHSAFALLCDSPAEVDSLCAAVAAGGHAVEKHPWDAPWGQRYAVLADPDGYLVDLFAPL